MKNLSDRVAWAMIAEMGWGMKADYKAIAKECFAKWGKTRMERLHTFAHSRVDELGKAVENYDDNSDRLPLCVGSDDSFSDLRFHVVGLGKEKFDYYMANIQQLERRYNASTYTESFDYCFMEPEPARTPVDKAKILATLLGKIRLCDEEMNVLAVKLEAVRLLQGTLVQLANQYEADCKNNS